MITPQQFKAAMLIVSQYCHQVEEKKSLSVTTIGCLVRLSQHGLEMQGKRLGSRRGKIVQFHPGVYGGDGTVWVKWDNVKKPVDMHESQVEPDISMPKDPVVDRSYADTTKVTLPCGYSQRFWVDITDEEAIKRTVAMKKLKIK